MASNFQLAGLAAAGDVQTTLNADRVTVHAVPPQGKTPYGVWVAPNGGAGNDSAVDLQGSVVDGFSKDFVATQSAGATAKVTTSYSAYRFGAGFKQLTGGATVTAGAGNFDLTGLSPNFIDPANGDLHLRFDSPLLERGDPNFNPFLGVDLDRNPRVRNGDGAGLATVDIGAYEYQRKAPVADVQASPSGPGPGETVTFDASGSTDPDQDAITFAWSFDDGGSATGPVAQHSFATPGPHTGTVTVTDSTGLTGTGMATVTVASPPGPGGGPGGGAPGLGALTLRGLRLAPATFRARQPRRARSAVRRPPVGTTIRFRLSADARVTFTVERPVRVRRRTRWVRAGAFTRSAKAGTNGVRFDGRFAGRALRPGRYRLRARARDGQGRLSPPAAPKSFVIATS
jgi:PKD repeat protein